MIKPLYKKGNTQDPKNYRGITLLPIIGKIFTQILSNRISLWAENHDMLCEAQFGFCKGRRTTDPIFSQAVHYANKKNKPVFACFVDLAKAFDSVNLELLWLKLAHIGLSSKILHMLQSIYENANSKVYCNNLFSEPFPHSKGV